MSKTILIVDDSKFTRKLLKLPLDRLGYWVETVGDPHEAIRFITQKDPDLVISDLKMPELMDGLGFLKMLAIEAPNLPVMIYTSDSRAEELVSDIGIKRMVVLTKPASPEKLREEIVKLLG